MKIKISKRPTHAHNELLLLQNVSARMWQNLVAFSSVIRQDFFLTEGPVCGQRRPFQDCTERPAAAVVGSNWLTYINAVDHGLTGINQDRLPGLSCQQGMVDDWSLVWLPLTFTWHPLLGVSISWHAIP